MTELYAHYTRVIITHRDIVVQPCLTYGLRGITYYKITISGPGKDLHSGLFGNTVHEVSAFSLGILGAPADEMCQPMTDLVLLMGRLVKPNGEILVPGLNELVAPLTDEEKSVSPSHRPLRY